jgi:hypothetical protein
MNQTPQLKRRHPGSLKRDAKALVPAPKACIAHADIDQATTRPAQSQPIARTSREHAYNPGKPSYKTPARIHASDTLDFTDAAWLHLDLASAFMAIFPNGLKWFLVIIPGSASVLPYTTSGVAGRSNISTTLRPLSIALPQLVWTRTFRVIPVLLDSETIHEWQEASQMLERPSCVSPASRLDEMVQRRFDGG